MYATLKKIGLILCLSWLTSTSVADPNNDVHCLALNIYHEARSESTEGQLAVALVTLNRVKSDRYPDTICKVVKQYKQFSWYWDGKSDKPTEALAWHMSKTMAEYVIKHFDRFNGDIEFMDVTDGSLWYYNPSIVVPKWHHDHDKIISRQVGNHLFLKERM